MCPACFLPRDPGPCKEEILRFHYNSDSNVRDCVGFIYGGCRGNSNNFKTAEECSRQCTDKISLRTTVVTKKSEGAKVSKKIPGCIGQYGCCDDYVTPAKGPNQEGCPGKSKTRLYFYNAICSLVSIKVVGACRSNCVDGMTSEW